ncbi:hypothetical protein [Candidatus Coxiella mudrowiae]|uniref:hypothetical protein n=1 Tax=Candidatus Coxiella mudrowiae TaxID=2054173 RepID=UPI001FD2B822|nr:hypothetical protein [Candidatus Coxiella mudrowiae]
MSFSFSNIRFELKNENLKLKRHLIDESVDEQSVQFIQMEKAFYAKSRRTEGDYQQFCEEI